MTTEPTARPSYELLKDGQVLGRYRVRGRLGAGGMAVVYEAEHIDLGKRCAIKILNPEYSRNAEVKARFLREGQAASRIGHENVVDVYDVASAEDLTYLVMEFLEGEDMGAFLEREGAISETRAADLLVPVASALARAHELQIVHRDVKPENIFLVRGKGSDVHPKVVDFGISKLVEVNSNDLTQTSAMLGTPMYMSPEQARAAKNVGFPTDQYSLGVIAYQAVTGLRPFESDTLYTLLHSIVSGDFKPPSSQIGINPRFEAIILRAMQNAPEDRFPSIDSMGAALLPFASERIRFLYQDDFQKDPSEGKTLNLPGSPSEDGKEVPKRASAGSSTKSSGSRNDELNLTESAATVAAVAGDVGSSGRPSPAKGGMSRGLLTALVGGGGAVAAVIGYLAMGASSSDSGVPEPVQSTSAEADLPSAAPEVEPTKTELRAEAQPAPTPEPRVIGLASNAPGTRLFVAGIDRGELPLSLPVQDGESRLKLEARAPGYHAETITWHPEDGNDVSFQLEPIRREPTAKPHQPPTPAKAQPPPSPTPTPSAPLLAPR